MPLGRPFYNPRPDIATSIAQGTGFTTVENAGQMRDWQDVVANDPNLARIPTIDGRTNYLRAVWGLPNTYKLDANGQIVDTHGFLVRNLWWIGPAAIVGGSVIGAAAGGGSGATSAAPLASNAGPGASTLMTMTPPALTAGGGGVGAAGATGAVGAAGVLPNTSTVATGALSTVPAPQIASEAVSAGVPLAGASNVIHGDGLPAEPSFGDRTRDFFSDPSNIARTAGLVPMFQNLLSNGMGDSPFNANSDLMKGINEDLGMQRQRMRQAQPIYDALINMAYGRTPTRYRGAAPSGYPSGGDTPPAGAYQYQTPRFG